jgi:asparagine synthase (glutamine-hydrolysing)
MCGIAGILSKKQIHSNHIKKMMATLSHRGLDAEGFWANETNTIHFGHRRLSIIDLSVNANQPFHYLHRYTLIFNGEIYNYIEIKNYLLVKGYQFSTKSDTEVIAAAYDFWGKSCLQKLDGMFAFAIWDEREQNLFCARDRFGEKPFFYYEDEEHFIFASEMKALWSIGIEKQMDNKMLLNYITLGQLQNPADKELTFFKEIYSLPPAHYLTINFQNFISKIHSYWRLDKESKIDINEADAIERFTELFNASIQKRLRSDVAIGTSLSGGLDSSSIVAFLANENQHLKTFSATFSGFNKDESAYIKLVTDKFNVQNFSVSPSADELINDFEKLCYHQEEPFSSSSIYAQYKVYELAKQQGVKVLLDGQGVDETLAGYNKYVHYFLQEVLSRHKFGATLHEKTALQNNSQFFNWGIKNYFAAFLPAQAAILLERKDYKKTFAHADVHPDFLHNLVGHQWDGIHRPIVTKLNDILHFNITEMGLEELLRFADRNSMAHSTEVRLPFLQHDLVEFIFSLPSTLKIHQGFTKYILRKTVANKLPDAITWRKDKVGFEPPQKMWMQNKNLQDYIFEAKKKLVDENILSPKVLTKKIEPQDAHAANNYDFKYLVAAQQL